MIGRAMLLLGWFVMATAIATRASHPEPTPVRTPLALFPMALGEWRGLQDAPFDHQTLDILAADDYLSRRYHRPGASGVGLFIGYYASQRREGTIHSPLNCLPGSGWEPVSRAILPISLTGDAAERARDPIVVNRDVVQKGPERLLVLYWYQSHGRVTASEYASKFYLMADAIQLNRTDGALIRVTTRIPPGDGTGEADAERNAVQFVRALFPKLSDYLPL